MLALLFFPPISDPTFPPHGVARLAGFLRARGRDVRTHDLNVEFFHHVLGPELAVIEADLERSVHALEAQEVLSDADWERYQAQARALLVVRPVLENIDAAKAVMMNRAWFDEPNTYNWAHHVLDSALKVVSARYFPTNFGFHNWSSGAPLDLTEVTRCLAIEDEPFRAFYAERLRDLVPAEGPVWFGISIMFLDQLVPALMLAQQLKALRPDASVALGGAFITHLSDQAATLLDAFPFVDVLVPGAGEAPLLALIDGAVPAGVFVRGGKTPSQAEVNRYDGTESPPPHYDAIALTRYLSPEPVLPIRGSRGCYWGRCVYCSHHMGEGTYAPRKPDDAFEELQFLRREHGARTFYLSDDALSPRFLRAFSDRLLAAEPDGVTVRWFGDARPEDLDEALIAHAARAGLVMLFLGVESANARVRGLMQRGAMDRVRRTINACHEARVLVKLNFILGFPGETQAELDETLAFIQEVRAPSDTISTCPFYLTRGSPLQLDRLPIKGAPDLGRQTRRKGLADVDLQIRAPAPDDLTLMYDFVTSAGQTAQGTIDDWLRRFGSDPRLQTSTWKVMDLSRVHKALLRDQHAPDDFVVASVAPIHLEPMVADALPFRIEGDPIVRVRPPVRARTFRYNLVARGGASRISPTAFVGDELLQFPNRAGATRNLCGVDPILGALIEGELRVGLHWSQLVERLEGVPDGLYAVQVLVRLGLLAISED